MTTACDRCALLEKQLEETRVVRDKALEALAGERAKVEAMRIALEIPSAPPVSRWTSLPDEPKPTRYVLADAANDLIKGKLDGAHRLGKRLADVLRSL
ncbi:MAG: hypothetical protein ACT4TC_07465 [Myxococcaceae bacterium]